MHHLVEQLHFTRNELLRSLEGVTPEEAVTRVPPMNCLSWIVGHLADQEHMSWVVIAQGKNVAPHLRGLVGHGSPASTPPLDEMLESWRLVTHTADEFLSTLDDARLEEYLIFRDKPLPENTGARLYRVLYHYWYHIGEGQAIRQIFGHHDLPEFVGILSQYPYRREG